MNDTLHRGGLLAKVDKGELGAYLADVLYARAKGDHLPNLTEVQVKNLDPFFTEDLASIIVDGENAIFRLLLFGLVRGRPLLGLFLSLAIGGLALSCGLAVCFPRDGPIVLAELTPCHRLTVAVKRPVAGGARAAAAQDSLNGTYWRMSREALL